MQEFNINIRLGTPGERSRVTIVQYSDANTTEIRRLALKLLGICDLVDEYDSIDGSGNKTKATPNVTDVPQSRSQTVQKQKPKVSKEKCSE